MFQGFFCVLKIKQKLCKIGQFLRGMTHKKISKKATFQWKMADGWCAEYKELDGKVFKTTDAQVVVNFPPMHPWCRSVTIANIDDDTLKTLDRRAGKEKVSANMTYYFVY